MEVAETEGWRAKEEGKEEWGIIALERREGQKEGND